MRVVLHGFGSFPVFFWHMIQFARQIKLPIEWAIILTSDHHLALFKRLLGNDRVLVLDHSGNEIRPGEEEWVYPGVLYRDMEANKRTYKHEKSNVQYRRAMGLYRQIRRFMSEFCPTHALVSQVEGFDGKAFIATAREFGSQVVVPTSCRNLGGLFFSIDDIETLPPYASFQDPKHQDAAKAFIEDFRFSPKPARWEPNAAEDELLDSFSKPLPKRLVENLRRWLSAPSSFQMDYLRASILNNLPWFRDLVWSVRRYKNQRYCDVSALEDLPKKFIFYPLQYSPESSINTPAPYYLDQMRAIDAIRFAMPSDWTLVVKEHPACILLRDGDFVRRLQHTAGVVVAHYRLPSLELVKRSGLTVSVTGTATLEALILGRSALTLGGSLISGLIGGICSLAELPVRLKAELDNRIPDVEVVSAIATLFSVRHEVLFGSPGIPGEPVLRRGNVERFTRGFYEHCTRMRQFAQ